MSVAPVVPSISQIYAAFDDACTRVFRHAMTRSRGGTVRVADVLAALAEALPDETLAELRLTLQALVRLVQPPPPGPDLLPMVNEPALRSILADAYVRAEGGPLTPLLLLRAVVRSRPHLPEPCLAPSPRPVSRPSSLTTDTVQAVLRRWLAVQSWAADAREQALRQLATLSPPE